MYEAVDFRLEWQPGVNDNEFSLDLFCILGRSCVDNLLPNQPIGRPTVCTTPHDDRLDCPVLGDPGLMLTYNFDRVVE